LVPDKSWVPMKSLNAKLWPWPQNESDVALGYRAVFTAIVCIRQHGPWQVRLEGQSAVRLWSPPLSASACIPDALLVIFDMHRLPLIERDALM
jgi:hypothetical protein